MSRNAGVKLVYVLAGIVVVIAGLKASQAFFVPVMLALFVATISYPVKNLLTRRKVPHFLAVLLTVIIDFAFIAGVVTIAISLFGDFEAKWNETYEPLIGQRIDESSEFLSANLTKWGVEDADKRVDQYFSNLWKEQLSNLEVGKVLSFGTGFIGKVASFLGSTFLVMILTIFMLTEATQFGKRFSAIANARGPNFSRILSAAKDVQRFLGIKTLISLATGVLAGFICWLAGIDFFILWGILAFALNFIPVVGSIIAGIPPAILCLLVFDFPRALLLALGYGAINVFLGNFVEPSLMGRRFGLSTLIVIVAVLFWGWMWGAAGMLLAVPLTMILKVALDNSYEFHWLAVAITPSKIKAPKRVPKPLKVESGEIEPEVPSDDELIDAGLETLNLSSTNLEKG